ncbi:MAG: GDSL-type esterase/lipase family protein [Microscillaceae bacterium]|nr:GDSL-type esterase/lipase family protein [Microscillaceae bacterium]
MFWYEEEVKYLEKKAQAQNPAEKVIFYGSSTIRLWDTVEKDFSQHNPVNLGFGGSTLAACVWFFERLILAHPTKSLIFYGGDNDLGEGRHPEEVFIFMQQLLFKVRRHLGNIPFTYISIKPSPARWHIADRVRFTNKIIRQEIEKGNDRQYFIDIYEAMLGKDGKPDPSFFISDGLHLSPKGYQVWKDILNRHSLKIF